MPEAEARIATYEASHYLTTLAEGWNHTYAVRYDNLTGEVALPGAELIMTADGDSLSLRLVSPDQDRLEATKALVAKHLDRAAGAATGIACIWHNL